MKYLIVVVAMMCIVNVSIGQQSGVFMTMKCTPGMKRHLPLLASKEVCIAETPIIAAREFGLLTNLLEARGRIFFDLDLSPKGARTLKELSSKLPKSGVAVVVEDQVISVFTASDIKFGTRVRFIGNTRYSESFQKAHEMLKSLIEQPKGE